MTYSEKLRDPRWQRVRLETFDRAGWKCERCDCKSATLHAHHGYYDKNLDPWDYPEESLHCLCSDCHKAVGEIMTEINQAVGTTNIRLLEEICMAIGDIRDRESQKRFDFILGELTGHELRMPIDDVKKLRPELWTVEIP